MNAYLPVNIGGLKWWSRTMAYTWPMLLSWLRSCQFLDQWHPTCYQEIIIRKSFEKSKTMDLCGGELCSQCQGSYPDSNNLLKTNKPGRNTLKQVEIISTTWEYLNSVPGYVSGFLLSDRCMGYVSHCSMQHMRVDITCLGGCRLGIWCPAHSDSSAATVHSVLSESLW